MNPILPEETRSRNSLRVHRLGAFVFLDTTRWRSGFSVPDLDVYHQRMVEHNVPCVQEPKDLFGARIAMYVDPDGLPFSVGEEQQKS